MGRFHDNTGLLLLLGQTEELLSAMTLLLPSLGAGEELQRVWISQSPALMSSWRGLLKAHILGPCGFLSCRSVKTVRV